MDNSGAWAGIILIVAPILLWVAGIIVSIWIAYEIIWRAVRRGMREFNADPQLPRNRPRVW